MKIKTERERIGNKLLFQLTKRDGKMYASDRPTHAPISIKFDSKLVAFDIESLAKRALSYLGGAVRFCPIKFFSASKLFLCGNLLCKGAIVK